MLSAAHRPTFVLSIFGRSGYAGPGTGIKSRSRGVVTPPQAVGVDRNDTSSNLYGRGGTGVCPGLRPKGQRGRLAAAY